jgi:hypothetical protein
VRRIALALFLALLPAAGCDTPLVPLSPASFADLGYVTVDARFCTTPPAPARQKVKYLFILDHSASNQPGFPNPLTPNDVTSTDPLGNRRYGPLVEFVQSIVPDPNTLTAFSLIDFNDTAYAPAGISGFEADAATFLSDVRVDWIGTGTVASPAPADKGFTNYLAALQLAESTILADAQDEAASPDRPIVTVSYHVVFVSDGTPTVASGSSVVTQTLAQLQPVVTQLLGIRLQPGLGPFISGIELDTAYYFQNQEIAAAEVLLQQLAAAGNGQYFQFGEGADIAYSNFAPPNRDVRYAFQDAWVDNLNSGWWDDGRFLLDSGGGGMPDAVRGPLGGKTGLPDSDGNGVRDLVEYRTKARVCDATGCAASGRDPYAICDGLEPAVASDGSVSFPSTSKSGLNDCESFVLGASLDTFSTNATFIPDLIGFKNLLPILPGADLSQADPFGDGVTNYLKLKRGLPLSVSQSAVSDFLQRSSTLFHEDSADPDTDCYHLHVENVAVLGTANRIRVSFIENATLIDDKPVILSAEAPASPQTTFAPEDFN